MKWVLIYWALGFNGGITGQAYFETRNLCEKAHEAVTKSGTIKAACLMAGETEN
jgi:hypothetical protein